MFDAQAAVCPATDAVYPVHRAGLAVLAQQVDLVAEPGQRARHARVVDVASRPVQEVAVEDEDLHEVGGYCAQGRVSGYRFAAREPATDLQASCPRLGA